MPGFNQISPVHRMRLIGTPDAPIILDLRLDEDFALDPRVIPTAQRHSHTTMAELAARLAGRQVVVSCLRGAKISEGAAAVLRCHGIAAEPLAGGHLALASASLPLVPDDMVSGTKSGSRLWVSRHRPKVDRLAKVVRAADTDAHAVSPQAAGLLAMSVGLSRMFRDDLQQLEAGMVIWDVLYRCARDGYEEGHDWPADRAK